MAETFEGLYVKFGANTVEFEKSVKRDQQRSCKFEKGFHKYQ